MSAPLLVRLPVEIKARELDATLLFACALAERGHRVLVGERRHLKHDVARSVYLGRTVTASVATIYRMQRDIGNAVVALDEEGLVIYSKDIYRQRRLGRETIRIPQALFAWGAENAALWSEELGPDAHRVHVVGNPRFDLLREPLRQIYGEQAKAYAQQYGSYVLFNSNFHWVNTRHRHLTRLPDPEDVEAGRFPMPPFYNADLARHRIALFRAYLEAVPEIARACPDLHFVIRPHPAEDPGPWLEATAGLANCSVVHRGEVTPWILGSCAVLHHSCTTAVESFVLGKPVLCYRPVADERLDPELPIRLSLQATTPGELLAVLRHTVEHGADHEEGREERQKYLERHLAATSGPLAAERMAEVVERLEFPRPSPRRRLSAGLWFARKKLRSFERRRRQKPFGDLFPPTSLEEVRSRVRMFGLLLGRFERIRIRERTTNLFEIST